MKPVNRLADSYHLESEEGVDAVFERMFQVVGKPPGGYAQAFDVSENTIKTWRRRGAVSTKFLQGFANEHGTTLDYLLYGDRGRRQDELALDTNERALVLLFRSAPKNLRDAAIRVLCGEPAARETTQIIKGDVRGQVAGRDIHNLKRKKPK